MLHWSSRRAFIIATTGAAVGLGNVWRFPYMAGTHGGSAFLLAYLLCVILIGLPLMTAEIMIGRRSQKNSVDAFRLLAQEANASSAWQAVGWLGAITLLFVLSFYSVVAGWSIAYLFKAGLGLLRFSTASEANAHWLHFTQSPLAMTGWHTLFLVLTLTVVSRGIHAGIEAATRWAMPLLYAILFIIIAYNLVHADFKQTLSFLFHFQWKDLNSSTLIAAMGHAFFTLALGAGAILTYGSYLPKQFNIAHSVWVIALLDVLVALLSGLAIFPIVFSHHLNPAQGPGLMFVTLPIAFSHIPSGGVMEVLFFLLLLCAAGTSSINLAEPMILLLVQKKQLSRWRAAWLVGIAAWVLGLASIFSFNVWKHLTLLGGKTLFDLITSTTTDLMLPLGGLGIALFSGYVMKRSTTAQEIHPKVHPIWWWLMRSLVPLAIIIILIQALISH